MPPRTVRRLLIVAACLYLLVGAWNWFAAWSWMHVLQLGEDRRVDLAELKRNRPLVYATTEAMGMWRSTGSPSRDYALLRARPAQLSRLGLAAVAASCYCTWLALRRPRLMPKRRAPP
jgi:hypothetical protein